MGWNPCRGSCSPPLIPHYMTRRADMKIQPYMACCVESNFLLGADDGDATSDFCCVANKESRSSTKIRAE